MVRKNMNRDIILSICVPTYNRAKHIARQLSFFEKEITGTISNCVEVIISNNASSDETSDVLSAYKGKHSWLHINENIENVGGDRNMRLLLSMAKGKYVWFPGDDDYIKVNAIGNIIEVLENNTAISYLYLSRRTINEESKTICTEGKTHCVKYDSAFEIDHRTLVGLILENFGDLKFQTSNIYLRENIQEFEKDICVYSTKAQENCHSLYWAIRSMMQGYSYFISEVLVLNGNEISWNDRVVDYMSIYDAEFVMGLAQFGFSSQECSRIANRQLAAAVAFYLTHPSIKKVWIEKGKPGWKPQLIPILIMLAARKVIRRFGLSSQYITKEIERRDFLDSE